MNKGRTAEPTDVVRRPDGSPARLLVVDDEESLVHLLNDALRFAGYEVAMARSGREALEQARQGSPDLVVLDVMLPDFDGFEVCRRLRRDGDDVPVVFLTARDDPDGLRTGFTGGGDDYLTKRSASRNCASGSKPCCVAHWRALPSRTGCVAELSSWTWTLIRSIAGTPR